MTRQPKTERQRAEEAYAVAQRKRNRLAAHAKQLRGDLEAVERELRDADRILDYRRQHPLLPAIDRTAHTTQENA